MTAHHATAKLCYTEPGEKHRMDPRDKNGYDCVSKFHPLILFLAVVWSAPFCHLSPGYISTKARGDMCAHGNNDIFHTQIHIYDEEYKIR